MFTYFWYRFIRTLQTFRLTSKNFPVINFFERKRRWMPMNEFVTKKKMAEKNEVPSRRPKRNTSKAAEFWGGGEEVFLGRGEEGRPQHFFFAADVEKSPLTLTLSPVSFQVSSTCDIAKANRYTHTYTCVEVNPHIIKSCNTLCGANFFGRRFLHQYWN